MINNKLISIIIPVYNSEKYIKKCIESIINQSYSYIEIILVDDGSKDKSGEICDYYAKNDKRIAVIHKKNEGAHIARNIGISVANGEYISFVDSDDWICENYILTLIENMVDCKADLIVCNYKEVFINEISINYGENREVKSRLLDMDVEMDKDFFVNGLVHPCWGKLYKTNIIKNNNILFKDLKLSEDTVFNLCYLKFCKYIKVLQDELYFYAHYDRHSSITKIAYKDIFENYLIVHEKFLEYTKCYKTKEAISIANNTMYPQYYSAFIKILMCKNLKRKQKNKILNKALSNEKITNCFKIKQENTTISIINKLIIRKKYVLLKYIFLYINFKN
ncbi:glycosyltransferase family 2 protein [Clostridium sp. NSJ-49]|uniref:glycosyltransferase n=1 Tax=Clostridium TaxID=1485 RepID=UPI00164AF12C|nr:glycosyltransferase family 2 protein [Clostridium sp. NSJ-49]